jgi:hypothetical protein
MSYEESLRSISLDADASIGVYTGVPGMPGSADPNAGKQYRFVKVTGAHAVGLATAATDAIVGVLQNKPQSTGMAATVGISGVTNVVAGGNITAGAKVAPDANGAAVVDATNGRCIALGATTTVGALVPVLIRL